MTLSVSDDGCGMEEEILSNLFEPFHTTKGLGKGSGLGLATVHGLVKQNGGHVNVFSEVGKGTNFMIYLPCFSSGNTGKAEAGNSEQHLQGRGETILLVEDEPAIMKMARMMLSRLGYNVLEAGSPEKALSIAEHEGDKIDLLMTDVVMPGMNGRELSDRLKAVYPDIKVLFMSGYTAEIIAQRGVVDDEVNFLQKPFSKKTIAEKVREALDR